DRERAAGGVPRLRGRLEVAHVIEHLDATVLPVRDVDQAVAGADDSVRRRVLEVRAAIRGRGDEAGATATTSSTPRRARAARGRTCATRACGTRASTTRGSRRACSRPS